MLLVLLVRFGACALLLAALAAAACDQPAPLPVAIREPSLEADDLAVIKGLIEDRLRPQMIEAALRGRPPGTLAVAPHLLVVDTTMAVCPENVVAAGPPPGGCMNDERIEWVTRVLPAHSLRTAALDFRTRNRRRLPIANVLGEGTTYISSTLMDTVSPGDVLHPHPLGSRIVTVSAPSYPAAGVAVLFYFVYRGEVAGVRLERQSDGRWTVAKGGWKGAIP